ncbi:MAG TPA: pseudouridine synthase [Treponemataceae bacterium]|nr:pseudouridine synthase [Treponemataceae bacterium]HQL03586.1 pseudouridine synthase [Treponemataceae bacterium]
MKTQRLDKILSHHGYGSRKDAKKLLHKGFVLVNGQICSNADSPINIDTDTVTVDGTLLQLRHHVYLMLNKPSGIVCSTKDGIHKTVIDILPPQYRVSFLGGDVHPVGRLDIDTEGLLLLTTDGEMTHRLTSPKKHISKTYYLKLADNTDEKAQSYYKEQCEKGFAVPHEGNEDGFITQESALEWLNNSGDEALLTIYEGKYHQVKRMMQTLGNEVVYLKRVAVGSLYLDEMLKPGDCRELKPEEFDKLI